MLLLLAICDAAMCGLSVALSLSAACTDTATQRVSPSVTESTKIGSAGGSCLVKYRQHLYIYCIWICTSIN